MGKLDGRTAIITGASRGMGASHARTFIAEGAKVLLTDLRADAGTALAAELGPNARFVEHDVTSAADWDRVVRAAEDFFGPVNILVNNAGILGAMAKTAEMTEADYLTVCAVNQHSVYLGMHAVIPSMQRGGRGSIVNISSIAGLIGSAGPTAYTAAKGAVRLLSKSVALYCAEQKYDIRCNSVHPGGVDTAIFNPLWQMVGHAQGKAFIGTRHPIGRMSEASELGEVVLFLASDRSSFVTGAEIVADGAITAGLMRRSLLAPP